MKYKCRTTTNKNTQSFLSKYKIRIYELDQNSVFSYNFKSVILEVYEKKNRK